jgi:hypothetical protein
MSGDVREQDEPRRQRTRRAPAGEPATVANLVKNGHDLSTWCRACESFGATLRYEDLLERFGPDFLALDVDRSFAASNAASATPRRGSAFGRGGRA